jgi:hypothetical protein
MIVIMARLGQLLSNFPDPLKRVLAAQTGQVDLQDRPVPEPGTVTKLQHPNHRLSAAELADIALAYEAGASVKALARQFGLHSQTVRAQLERAGFELRPKAVVRGRVVAPAARQAIRSRRQ